MVKCLSRFVFLVGVVSAAGLVAAATALGDTRAETTVFKVESSFGSGSCSGETVNFTGAYHEVLHVRYDEAGNVIAINVMTGESGNGIGIGEISGDRYARVYHNNGMTQYQYDPYTETATTTYLTRVIHLGKDDGVLDDLWVQSTVHYRATESGWVRYHETYRSECY